MNTVRLSGTDTAPEGAIYHCQEAVESNQKKYPQLCQTPNDMVSQGSGNQLVCESSDLESIRKSVTDWLNA